MQLMLTRIGTPCAKQGAMARGAIRVVAPMLGETYCVVRPLVVLLALTESWYHKDRQFPSKVAILETDVDW